MSHDLRSVGEAMGRYPFKYVCLLCHEEFSTQDEVDRHWKGVHVIIPAPAPGLDWTLRLDLTAEDRELLRTMGIGDA